MGSFDFAMTRNQIIESALETIGVLGMGQNPSIEQITRANRELNSLIKNLDFGNALSWRAIDTTISLVAGTASYAAADGVIGIKDPFLRVNDQDTPIGLMNYPDYQSTIRDKTAQGTPSKVTFKESLAGNTIYVTPVPAESGELHVLAIYEIQDMDNPSDVNLFPKSWGMIIVWKLAAILSYHYGIDPTTRQQIQVTAEEMYQKGRMDNFITKIGSEVYFEPF